MFTIKIVKWYAIHTRSRHEKQVDLFLRERGIETFLPLIQTLSRRRDRKKYVDIPLFPGYLFVCTEKERLYDVKYTRGVTRIIGTDMDTPTPIPDKQILDIKSIMESDVKLDPFPYLKKGRTVRVKSGPLKGLEGILVERKGHYKLVIRIDLLQKGAAAEVYISDIEPI
jgi:transcription elongation factor/antiterminator RfaH